VKWFLNLKTSVKLISAFVLVAIILAYVGFSGLNNLGKLNVGMDNLYSNNLTSIDHLSGGQILYQRVRVNIRDMHILGTEKTYPEYIKKLNDLASQVDSEVSVYAKTPLTAEEEVELKKFYTVWDKYKKFLQEAMKLNNENKSEEFKAFLAGGFKLSGDDVDAAFEKLVQMNVALGEKSNKDGKEVYASSRSITILVVIISLLLSVALGWIISQVISRPLNRVVTLVGKVANGDLRETMDINTKDEIGQLAKSVNDMVLNLKTTVGGILTSAESVAAAAEQISASTEEIASGTTSQANDAQTMNELFKELSSAINSVAVSAEQAAEMSNDTLEIANEGGKVIRSSIEGMNLVNGQMTRLAEDSNKIGEIIEVIDEIAEQTNLLALNAAIEAARAGEQGRGFAVVADEVRKLAERSGEATKQITAIIKGMQENTEASVKAVGEGVVSSEKTGVAFEKIIAVVNDSAQKVTEIAAASEEQAAQSAEVTASINSISASTQEAAASSEETAATAQSLAQLAEDLNRSVSIFKVN
jgi:methyl-accepting chemotaxis protein